LQLAPLPVVQLAQRRVTGRARSRSQSTSSYRVLQGRAGAYAPSCGSSEAASRASSRAAALATQASTSPLGPCRDPTRLPGVSLLADDGDWAVWGRILPRRQDVFLTNVSTRETIRIPRPPGVRYQYAPTVTATGTVFLARDRPCPTPCGTREARAVKAQLVEVPLGGRGRVVMTLRKHRDFGFMFAAQEDGQVVIQLASYFAKVPPRGVVVLLQELQHPRMPFRGMGAGALNDEVEPVAPTSWPPSVWRPCWASGGLAPG
jgi:hypothetical protein